MKTFLSVLFLAVLGGTSAIANGPPVNDTCPVCGKNGRMIFRVITPDKGTVIFHSAECMDAFQKAPSKYPVKPKPKQ